jgi:hypothetical protein
MASTWLSAIEPKGWKTPAFLRDVWGLVRTYRRGPGDPHRDLRPGTELQLAEKVFDVALNGALADRERAGDVVVRKALSDQCRDLTLSGGETDRCTSSL